MDSKLFKAFDLHVHTPASSDYKCKGDDEEYYRILQRYVDEKVNLIAITDHNTIEGYKKLMDLKSKLSNFIFNLEQLEREQGLPIADVESYKKKYEMFNQLCILPGIELDVNPGIHILVIFNDKQEIVEIEKLLIEIGYESDCYGHDKLGNISVDVLDLFEILSEYDCIVIAAHADSSKGIYDEIEGQYRAQIFRNERLNGIQYLSQKSADQMMSLLNNKEYQRKSPLAFIKASDFHGNFSDKPDIIYGDLVECNYDNLKKVFQTPEQSISLTENPEVKSLIDNVLQLENSISVDINDNQEKIKITKELCAVMNCNYGNLVIGVSNDTFKNFNGVSLDFENLEKILKQSIEEIEMEKKKIELHVTEYPWGKKRIFVIHIRNKNGGISFLKDNTSYVLEKGKVKQSNVKMLISKAEDNLVMKIKKYMDKNNKRISKLAKELTLLSNLNSCFSFILNIEESNFRLIDIVDVDIVRNNSTIEFEDPSIAGLNKYNVVLPSDFTPRLDDSYLRLLSHGIYVEGDSYDKFCNEKVFKGNCILVMPKGATYFVDSDEEYYIYLEDTYKPCLRVTINEKFKDKITYKSLIAWLKSSLLIFYTYVNFENTSIYEPNTFKNIPVFFDKEILQYDKLMELCELVLSKEREFISKYENARNQLEELDSNEQTEEYDELDSLITSEFEVFNDEIKLIMAQIDNIYYEVFDIDNENKVIINDILDINNLFVYEECILE